MADKPTQLVLEALGRAAADPGGLPLLAGRGGAGLFQATPAGKQAAQRCKELGYVRPVRTEARGKTLQEVCAITEKGLAFLISQVSPRQVLEDLVRTLEARRVQAGELVAAARQTQASLEGLKAAVEKVLQQLTQEIPLPNGRGSSDGRDLACSETWEGGLPAYLAQWQADHPSEDCPLPELFRYAQQQAPGLTIGQFHDGLRRFHAEGQIYLHPWTGPLYDLPEPAYAMLAGHEIVYYVSLRGEGLGVRG